MGQLEYALMNAVAAKVGVQPQFTRFSILSDTAFDREVPQSMADRLTGGTAAITTDKGEIFVREGYEDSAVHELLHAAGIMPHGVSNYINEGLTQHLAEEIAKDIDMPVRGTYGDEVQFVRDKVLPYVGDEQEFFQGYAVADDKAKYTAEQIWVRHGDKFTEKEGWSDDPGKNYKGLMEELRSTIGTSSRLEFLKEVDERRAPPPEERAVEEGPRGGRFYRTSTGAKVYVK